MLNAEASPARDVHPPTTGGYPDFAPVRALSKALNDTLILLFRPLDVRLWLGLSFICLFLGGGTSSAAFNWSLGSLPGDLGFQEAMARWRQYLSDHLWLIVVGGTAFLGAAVGLLYMRAMLRFVLVDSILHGKVTLARAWKEVRPMGRSYFRWLLAALMGVGLALTAGAVTAFPHLRALAAGGVRSVTFWAELVAILVADVGAGAALAILVALTDDLAVPLMYAEQLPLSKAWRQLAALARERAGAFLLYVLLRLVVSVVAGALVLLVLFPILVFLFSGAVITGVVVVLGLRLLGVGWTWNPLTMVVALLALMVLTGVILILLSVVSMPAQVLLQAFGIRFVAPAVPRLTQFLAVRELGRESRETFGEPARKVLAG